NGVARHPAVTLPILLPTASVNHRLPSGPAVMSTKALPAVGIGYSVKFPEIVTFPILLLASSVNHKLPSGPTVMSNGWLPAVGTEYSVKPPEIVTFPILLP